MTNLNYILLFNVIFVELKLEIAEVKFGKKFSITVKMLMGKWILFWNSTVITKVGVKVKPFFKYEIQLCKITANMYRSYEGIYK